MNPPFGGYAVIIDLDTDSWYMADRQFDDQRCMTEWVKRGQTVDNWDELITVIEFLTRPFGIAPEEYLSQTVKELLRAADGRYSVFRDDYFPREIILKADYGGGEGGIHRWVIGPLGVYCFQYAKKSQINDDDMRQWLPVLKGAYVEEDKKQDDVSVFGKFAEDALRKLAGGDNEGFLDALSDNVKAAFSRDAIESDLMAPFRALLQDASLDPDITVHNCTDAYGSQGFTFYMKANLSSGQELPFAIYVVKEGSRLAIANMIPDKVPS